MRHQTAFRNGLPMGGFQVPTMGDLLDDLGTAVTAIADTTGVGGVVNAAEALGSGAAVAAAPAAVDPQTAANLQASQTAIDQSMIALGQASAINAAATPAAAASSGGGAVAPAADVTATTGSSNTLLYIAGGLALAVGAYILLHKKHH